MEKENGKEKTNLSNTKPNTPSRDSPLRHHNPLRLQHSHQSHTFHHFALFILPSPVPQNLNPTSESLLPCCGVHGWHQHGAQAGPHFGHALRGYDDGDIARGGELGERGDEVL